MYRAKQSLALECHTMSNYLNLEIFASRVTLNIYGNHLALPTGPTMPAIKR